MFFSGDVCVIGGRSDLVILVCLVEICSVGICLVLIRSGNYD